MNNVVTISGTPTVAGLYNYTITLTGGCGNITKTGKILVRPDDTITLSSTGVGGGTNIVLSVTSLELNSAGYVFLCANGANVEYFAFRGFTTLQTHSATTYTGGHGAVIISLDPEGLITNTSPYIQNCTSFNDNAVGIKIDGLLHASASSNRSILANDFTQINSDGLGVWAANGGRGEMVSVFTYYNHIGYLSEEDVTDVMKQVQELK